jgi:hypothetical protein
VHDLRLEAYDVSVVFASRSHEGGGQCPVGFWGRNRWHPALKKAASGGRKAYLRPFLVLMQQEIAAIQAAVPVFLVSLCAIANSYAASSFRTSGLKTRKSWTVISSLKVSRVHRRGRESERARSRDLPRSLRAFRGGSVMQVSGLTYSREG